VGRKLLIIFSSFVFLLGLFATRVFAQEQAIDSVEPAIGIPDFIPPYPMPEPGFLGQDHDYSLVFRGNGEAVVSIRVVLTNKGEDALSEISLRVPKVIPREIFVYQVIREKQCIRYKQQVYDPIIRTYPPQECAEYQDPDYYSYYGRAKYQRAENEYESDTVKITLPKPIDPDKSGSYFIYFRALGYAKKSAFSVFKYEFESLKVDDDIRNLRVGISTDSDLVLRGAEGEVQYRFTDVSEATFSAVGGVAPLESTAVDTFYRSIGQGRIMKSASNLAPLESYTVEGSYADNRLQLFAKEILTGLLIALVLIAIAILIIRLIVRRVSTPAKSSDAKPPSSEIPKMALISTGVGFASSLLMAGYTLVVILLGSLITNTVSYQYNSVVVLFLVLISFGVYTLLLFGPALYFGVKKGIGWGIATAILTVFWLFLFLGVAVLVIFLVGASTGSSPIRPLPLLENFSG
jgi:hypothetical protein